MSSIIDVQLHGINNIVDDAGDNKTISMAIDMIDSGSSMSSLQNKIIGLNLLQIGQAEINSLRIQQLQVAAFRMEQRLFSEVNIDTVDPRKLLGLYEQSLHIIEDATEFIRTTLKGIDWKELQLQLVAYAEGLETDVSASNEEAKLKQEQLAKLTRKLLAEAGNPAIPK